MTSPQALMASPLEEEDISRVGVLHEDPASNTPERLGRRHGKQKQRAEDPFSDDGLAGSSDEEDGGAESYPPLQDGEAEARRVEENLRQWEQAERQRRKAARDSASSVATSSLVSDVTRRASLLWSSRRSKHASQGSGTHQVLRNTDDAVQMDDIDNAVSVPVTPEPDNPFVTPAASTTSLNDPQHSAVMAESYQFSTSEEDEGRSSSTAALQSPTGRSSQSRSHPPPKPLDLPSPRTPPHTSQSSPHASRPPEPLTPPTASRKIQEEEEEEPPSRWWTDWLCGCRERGDSQAGRTNPFE